MNSAEFKQLIAKRESWYRSTLENEFDFTPILSGLYSDSSHFVYEILQNAEDAEAKSITFNLFADRLEVFHNGKPFIFKDVESITSIGKSTKTEDITAIGKFGVGFKSVYAITQSPTIRSGEFDFTIKNFVVPSLNADRQSHSDTCILLPFDHQSRTADQTRTLVRNRLENLGLLTLLFLKHIAEVAWNESGSGGQYKRSAETEYKGFKNVCRVRLQSLSTAEEYLVFERPITISDKELRVEIAYKIGIDEHKERIVHSTTSKLFVFFPTNEETYLKFLIQGPFRTTPARDNIPFEDVNNRWLIQEIATLVGESLSIVRRLGFLDIGFLKILPLKEFALSKQEIYKAVSDAVTARFKSDEPLIPTLRNNHCTASKTLLANGKDLAQLLGSADVVTLFKRSEWINTDITEARAPDIRDFLISKLGVPEIDFEKFGRTLTAEFLQQKDISWFIEFYKLLKGQKSLWRSVSSGQPAGILRTKPIIRLEDGQNIAPFDSSGKVQAYLPTPARRKTHFKTVHKDIVADEEALNFLRELGFREPDLFAEITEYVIPKYQSAQVNPASNEYFEDFSNLIVGFQEVRSDKKKEFIHSLMHLRIVLSRREESGQDFLAEPSEVYFPTRELQNYFSGSADVLFVSPELYKQFGQTEVEEFLVSLGAAYRPRRIQIDGKLNNKEKKILRSDDDWRYDNFIRDFNIDGLDHALESITKEKSLLLWNYLIEAMPNSTWQAENFFKGEYSYHIPRHDKIQYFDASFLKKLKNTKWLFDQSDQFKKSNEITVSQLAAEYERKSPLCQILIQQLGFKPDVHQQLLQQLSQEERKKFEVLLNLSCEELEQMAALVREKSRMLTPPSKTHQNQTTNGTTTADWKPEVNPDQADISKQPFIPSGQKHPTPSNSLITMGEMPSDTGVSPEEKPDTEPRFPAHEVGRWGEEYVFRAVCEEYNSHSTLEKTVTGLRIKTHDNEAIEVIWLNIKRDLGTGCDFIIKQNGVDAAYIEVKSTTEDKHHLFPITGTQWEFARKLFNEGQGDKYWIYCVFNAGKKNCRIEIIQNPIKLWREGKLYAHPINFEL